MLPSNLDSLAPTQRLILEQAYVMAQELDAAADSAPEGQVIDRCESFLLGNGRDFLRKVLESTLQTRAVVLEKKGVPPESAHVGRRDATKARRPKR
jgi:hypothetical protein